MTEPPIFRVARRLVCALVLAGVIWAPGPKAAADRNPVGYTDTPYLPGGKWRVHDPDRPHPRVVTPGAFSTQEQPGRPPSDAIVLFDGTDLSKWQAEGEGADKGKTIPAQWKVENGYFEVVPKTGNVFTKEKFGDIQLHLEWAAPPAIEGASQGRGNSGVLIMGLYEVQVLDSYNNLTYADGQAGAIYGQYPPLVNAVRKPGEWQVYDIVFEAPRFEDGQLARPAYLTVFLNGVLLHHHKASLGPMRHRVLTKYEPHAPELPLMLQSHSNPVRYRNIWVRRLGDYDDPEARR